MGNVILISTTTEKKEDAAKLAQNLLEKRLIACAQISGPISSHYRWQEELVHSEEFILNIKTVKAKAEVVTQEIIDNHPYDLPEVIGVEPSCTSREYAAWVEQEIDT